MSQRNRFKELTAKSPKVTENVSRLPIEAPAPVDLEAQKIADRLMAQFSRPVATGEAAPEPRPTVTMSTNDQEHTMLKNQKAAESRALAAEKKVEQLEKSLEVVTINLSALFME